MIEKKGSVDVIDKLLAAMDSCSGFAGMGTTVQTVSNLIEEDGHHHKIVSAILKDSALTARLMQIANSSRKNKGGGNISTVDQFLSVYGLNKVRSIALSLAVLNNSGNKKQQDYIQSELVSAFFCGILASSITQENGSGANPQESQVCGLMQNLGRMMVLFYRFDDFDAAIKRQAEKNITDIDAITQLIGVNYDEVGSAIAEHWGLPPILLDSIGLNEIEQPEAYASSHQQWHVMCAMFCRAITNALFRAPHALEKRLVDKNINFFKKALDLDESDVMKEIQKCLEETDKVLSLMQFPGNVKKSILLLRKASERSIDLLMEGDSLVKKAKGDEHSPIELVKCAMRNIHAHCNFDNTLICLPLGSGLVAIAGIGNNAGVLITKFRSAGVQQDIFKMIISRKIDAIISDVRAPAYEKVIPAWYFEHAHAASFVMLPVIKDLKLIGLVYGDYSTKPDEMPTDWNEGEMVEWRRQLLKHLDQAQVIFKHSVLTGVFSELVH